MSKGLLRWFTVIIPVGFVFLLIYLENHLWQDQFRWLNLAVILVLLLIGTAFFSNWVFKLIDQRETEIHRRGSQLEALNMASLALITELDLGLVREKVVDLSRELVSSRTVHSAYLTRKETNLNTLSLLGSQRRRGKRSAAHQRGEESFKRSSRGANR